MSLRISPKLIALGVFGTAAVVLVFSLRQPPSQGSGQASPQASPQVEPLSRPQQLAARSELTMPDNRRSAPLPNPDAGPRPTQPPPQVASATAVPGPAIETQPPPPPPPPPPAAPTWPGVASGAVLRAQPAGAVCEDGLRSGLLLDMPSQEPLALADGSALPVGTPVRVRVASVQKASGSDPTVARLQLQSVQWNGSWQVVNAGAYRIPFERKRSVGSSALKGTAIGAAGGAVVSIVFKTDLAQSVLVGAAAGTAIGAATAGGTTTVPCIDPTATAFGFQF